MPRRETNEEDWVRTYRETVGPLYQSVSRRVGGDRDLAEDVTQEAWLRAVESWRKKGPPDDPAAWLRAVARNLLRNHFKRRRPDGVAPSELEKAEAELDAVTPDAAAWLHWGLARLRDAEARLLEAHHLDGKGVRVLATELGVTERAVEGRLRRARIALRQTLLPHFRS